MKSVKAIYVSIVLFCVFAISSISHAKSVFSVASQGDSAIKAFNIVDDDLEFQDDVESVDYSDGATSMSVMPRYERVFVIYEDSNKITWSSTNTLEREIDYGT